MRLPNWSRRQWLVFHGVVHPAWITLAIAFAVGAFTGAHYATFRVGGVHGTPVQTLSVPLVAVQSASSGLQDHKGSRSQVPAGASAEALTAARAQDARLAKNDKLPRVFPDAAPEQRGCVTRLVQNYSSRNGVAPRAFVLHYTVSANRPGWSDVDAVVGLFDTWAYQASSNYVIDGEGNCAYIVRETDKAWTQAAANPVAISVEVIATGQESAYIDAPGLKKLAMVISDALYRWKIPLQLGAFSNGVLTRPGVLDHRMLGAAGGGHFDIDQIIRGQFDDASGLARTEQVIAAVKAFRASQKPKPLPRWYVNAKNLPPMWAWISWRDHGHPLKLRPKNVPRVIPGAWWTRYAQHVKAARKA